MGAWLSSRNRERARRSERLCHCRPSATTEDDRDDVRRAPARGGRATQPMRADDHYDQISRESYTNVGGGAAYSVTDTFDVFGSFTMTVSGRNTHAVNRGLSLGLSWSFGDPGEKALMTS